MEAPGSGRDGTLDVGLGLLPPREGPDPFAHRRGEPRTFAALWVFFVFAVLVSAFSGLGWYGLGAADVYRPASRVLMVSLAVGVWIVWPLIRLSQESPGQPVRAAWTDWVLVVAPVLGAIAPQGLPWMAAWPWQACVGLGVWMAGWAALAGGVLAWTFVGERRDAQAAGSPERRGVRRTLAMLVLVGVALAGPALLLVRGSLGVLPTDDVLLLASPLGGAWAMTQPQDWAGQSVRLTPVGQRALVVLGGAVVVVWGMIALKVLRSGRVLHRGIT